MSDPISVATIAGLIGISAAAGHVIHAGYNMAEEGIEQVRSEPAITLLKRCINIAEMIYMMNNSTISSTYMQTIIQTLVTCVNWANKYEKKFILKKFVFSDVYKERFYNYNMILSTLLQDTSFLVTMSYFTGIENNEYNSVLNKIIHNPNVKHKID